MSQLSRSQPRLLNDPPTPVINRAHNSQSCTLSVILPTRNESDNVQPLLARLTSALQGIAAEIIFVDDSSDNTPEVIRDAIPNSPLAVRLISRAPGQRQGGLGGAVVAGLQVARGTWVCVMDADLQHPPEQISKMLRHAQDTSSDLVIASRFADGAQTPGLDRFRTAISTSLTWSARAIFIKELRNVTDPLTGFFLLRRDKLDLDRLHPNGFKILLEIIVQFPRLSISELGFVMEARHSGESKASMQEVLRYYQKLIELRLTRGNPRFLRFALVGLSGILVNNLSLVLFTEQLHIFYLLSAILATQLSTLWNFVLTELWVFSDRRQRVPMWGRLAAFYLINNALLTVRGPLISGLVEWFSMNYVLANLISIVLGTLLRYDISTRWLWAAQLNMKKPNESPRTAK